MEDSANELINMLCMVSDDEAEDHREDYGGTQEEEEQGERGQSPVSSRSKNGELTKYRKHANLSPGLNQCLVQMKALYRTPSL